MCRYIIDRFEGEVAVLEDESKSHVIINKSLLPKNSKIYDVIILNDNTYCIDSSATSERKKTIQNLENELFE